MPILRKKEIPEELFNKYTAPPMRPALKYWIKIIEEIDRLENRGFKEASAAMIQRLKKEIEEFECSSTPPQ